MAAKETFAQIVRFEQTAELQERGGVGHAFGLEINPGKTLQGLAVVEGVFEGFVGQPIRIAAGNRPATIASS